MGRSGIRRVALALAAIGLALGAARAHAGSVVSTVTVGGDDRAVEVLVTASLPLGWVLAEDDQPFTVTLLFGDAAFAFPDVSRTFEGVGLAELRAETLTRDGQTLARLVLTFARATPYTVTREGSRVRVRADAPAPGEPVTIGPVGAASPPAQVGGVARPSLPVSRPGEPEQSPGRPPSSAGGGAPAPKVGETAPAAARVRAVRPESDGRVARLAIEIDGSPTIRTSTLVRPDRVVLDLEGARFPEASRSIGVGDGLLRRVRIAQRTKTVVRIVCDLGGPAPFWVEPVPGGLVLHLGAAVR
jgi:hypothetical protein